MPLVQGGPPELIWERTADPLRWSIIPSERDQEAVYGESIAAWALCDCSSSRKTRSGVCTI
jgi:hypothetical protein